MSVENIRLAESFLNKSSSLVCFNDNNLNSIEKRALTTISNNNIYNKDNSIFKDESVKFLKEEKEVKM